MTPFESSLAAALEAEVQETAMSVDTNRGSDELEARMDAADRTKRRQAWLAAAAAVVVVGVAAVVLAGGGSDTSEPPSTVTPTPTPRSAPPGDFMSTEFFDRFSATLPQWVTEALSEPTAETADWVTWNRCDTDSVCIGLSFDRFAHYFAPGEIDSTPIEDYAGYVAYLKSLGGSGDLVVSDVSQTTIGGRPATLLTVTTRPGTSVIAALGCYVDGIKGSGDCWDFWDGVPTRLAIVDTGDQPLVILTRTPVDNPYAEDWTAQVESMCPRSSSGSPNDGGSARSRLRQRLRAEDVEVSVGRSPQGVCQRFEASAAPPTVVVVGGPGAQLGEAHLALRLEPSAQLLRGRLGQASRRAAAVLQGGNRVGVDTVDEVPHAERPYDPVVPHRRLGRAPPDLHRVLGEAGHAEPVLGPGWLRRPGDRLRRQVDPQDQGHHVQVLRLAEDGVEGPQLAHAQRGEARGQGADPVALLGGCLDVVDRSLPLHLRILAHPWARLAYSWEVGASGFVGWARLTSLAYSST